MIWLRCSKFSRAWIMENTDYTDISAVLNRRLGGHENRLHVRFDAGSFSLPLECGTLPTQCYNVQLWKHSTAVWKIWCTFYCATQICIARTCYGNVAGWLAVTRRYCIKTAKPILKLFRPSGSHIILVSSDPCADTQFPSVGALNTRGWGKLAIFVRFSTEIAVGNRCRKWC